MPSLQVLPQSRSPFHNSTSSWSPEYISTSNHKSVPTCTISLAHAEAVVSTGGDENTTQDDNQLPKPMLVLVDTSQSTTATAPRSRLTSTSSIYSQNEVNIIPFPTTSPPTSPSLRPLPIPPKAHALLRGSASIKAINLINNSAPPPPTRIAGGVGLENLPRHIRKRRASSMLRRSPLGLSVVNTPSVNADKTHAPAGLGKRTQISGRKLLRSPPPMQRRRSRDPNIADHLVVEVDDTDAGIVAVVKDRMGGTVVVEDDDDEDQRPTPVQEDDLPLGKAKGILLEAVELPKRPCSPTPETPFGSQVPIGLRASGSSPPPPTTPTSPESAAPPAYSSLPPPYTVTTYEGAKTGAADLAVKVDVVADNVVSEPVVEEIKIREERQPAPIVVPLPVRNHKSSISTSSSGTQKRSRISTSELKVLVYLYRTVVYGLEMRRRKEEKAEHEASTSRATTPDAVPTVNEIEMATAKALSTQRLDKPRRPLGPRSSSSSLSSPTPRSMIPPPEPKFHFEDALFSAASRSSPRTAMLSKGKERSISSHSARGFGAFPLVEEDDGIEPIFNEDTEDMEEDYVIPRTPAPTPSQSPRSSPAPLSAGASVSTSSSASSSRTSTPPPTKTASKKEKSKAEINQELDVQDALLAIRLREFLRSQGVCEGDLTVEVENQVFNENQTVACGMNGAEASEDAMVKSRVEALVEHEDMVHQLELDGEDEDNGNILDEYFMGIEEEEGDVSDSEIGSNSRAKSRGVLVEEDDQTPAPVFPTLHISTGPANTINANSMAGPSSSTSQVQRTISPPPNSPSPRPRAVLPPSYMVALLTMRMRHPSRRPSSSSSSSSDKGEKGRKASGNIKEDIYGTKRKSGLRVVVEVD